jgi:hypothetical protein
MNEQSPLGDTFDRFLEEEGILEEVHAGAIKRVLAWQFEEARKAARLGKVEFAAAMGTSRSQIERILDPANVAVSLETLSRAADALGKRLKIELIDPPILPP